MHSIQHFNKPTEYHGNPWNAIVSYCSHEISQRIEMAHKTLEMTFRRQTISKNNEKNDATHLSPYLLF